MHFKMVALTRCKKTGAYIARKGIPADVRDAHEKLYGARWEAKFYARGSGPLHEVRRRFSEWQAGISSRIEALRRAARGEGRTLSHREAHALAGEWYAWFVAQHEDEPGGHEEWDHLLAELTNARLRYAPVEAESLPPEEANEVIDADSRVQGYLQQIAADRALVSRFLAEREIVLAPEARERFLAVLVPEYAAALNLLRRRAYGDYSKDRRPAQFPKITPTKAANMTCWELFEAWVKERQPKPSTVDRRRGVFLHLQEHFGDRDIAAITDQDAVKWKDGLLTPERSGRTVNDVWLVTVKGIFKWAVINKKIGSNPFAALRVTYAKTPRDRDSRAFTIKEANTILRASSGAPPARLSAHYKAARRWVPWICAYAGCRVQEATQLRAEDIVEESGVWAIRLVPSAGTVKGARGGQCPFMST
jgi:hypothetical protein